MIDLDKLVKDATIEAWGIEPERYSADSQFCEMGADSLDVIELYMAVEEQLGIPDISEEAEIHTPAQLVAYIKQNALEGEAQDA